MIKPTSILARALLALLLFLPAAAGAQTIYSWTGEDGITHFTDRKPETSAEVSIQRAVPRRDELLIIESTGTDEAPVWLFRNRAHGPLEVEVEFAEADNVVSYPELPARFVLPPDSARELVTIGALDPRRSWRYRLQSRALPGDPQAEPDLSHAYRPPFAEGESFRITQGFDGSFSHNQPHSRHALDFDMPVGTPVHAARAGVVMDHARFFYRAGEDLERDGPRANFIRILHDDGSMAVYAHLDYEGVEVRPGDRVRRGQRIGRSGNTGFSTGPHLHFVIQVNRGLALESIPFVFEGPEESTIRPVEGMQVSAPNH